MLTAAQTRRKRERTSVVGRVGHVRVAQVRVRASGLARAGEVRLVRGPLLGQREAARRQGGELALPALALGDPFAAQRPAVGGGGERPDLRGQPADGRALGGDLLLEPG